MIAEKYGVTLPPFERRNIGPRENIDKFEPSIDSLGSEWTKTASGGATGPYPFDVTFTAGSDASHRTATIRPGTVNGFVPTDILTTADLSVSSSYYLVLSIVAVDGGIASCTIAFTTVAPGPILTLMGQPPLSFDYSIGMVVGDGSELTWYRTIGSGSLFATPQEAFRVSKVAPAPGTLPYDIYYTWALANA